MLPTDPGRPDLSGLRIRRETEDTTAGNPTGTRKFRRIFVLVGLLLILAVCYVLFRGMFTSATEVDVTTASLTYPSQESAVLTASGYVVAQRKAAVASKGTGRLEYLGVEEGDRVKKGTIIARLEDQDVLAALAQAKAGLEVSRADLLDAERSLARTKTLFSSNLAAQADLDAAQATYDRVRATIVSSEAGVRAAEVAVENTRIRAPFDGTVLTKDADVGEVVAPFASSINSRGAVVTMADMSSLQVEADVSESNFTRVRAGQPCEIVLDAYPNIHSPGRVHKIVPTADRAKATVMTKVVFDKLDSRVLPEMSAKVTFLSGDSAVANAGAPPLLTVMSSAIVERTGKPVVFVVRDGKVTETPVRTGRVIGNRTEILEGISQGDQLVLDPAPGIVTGTIVKPRSK
jgi:RND family efflux transporter MFP subunit